MTDTDKYGQELVPANQNTMIEWAVKSSDPVYTNAGTAYYVLKEALDGADNET